MNIEVALWAAQELAARRALGAALEAEKRRFQERERARNQIAIFNHMIEKEEREL